MDNLIRLLKAESKEINHFFEKASIEGQGTPQEVSDRREIALTKFLKKFFPFPYRIAKGNIRDSYGLSSMSIDCVLLNPSHPYTTSDKINFSVILADGVDAAIEVKPKLNSDKEIERSLNQIASVKRLTRKRTSVLNLKVLGKQHSPETLANAKKIPSIIFAIETYKNDKLLLEKIVDFYEKNQFKRDLQFDFIVINGHYVIVNIRKGSYFELNGKFDNGLYIYNYGELTLTAFLMLLNKFPPSEMRNSSTVLEHYIDIKPENAKTFNDLNNRLNLIEK
jgi:hypothetical protein